MKLADVHQGVKTNRARKRIGRGPGSGQGKTAGKGHKGQKSRAGWSAPAVFQGGAMPLVRRVPKRGFHNKFAPKVAVINTCDLHEAYADGESVTLENLKEKSLLKGRFDLLKVLGRGILTKKLTVSAHRFSKTAEQQIQQAGGKVVVLPGKVAVADKQPPREATATKSS